MPVCGAVCFTGICRGIQPLRLAHPCVCMGKDKDIQSIPESEKREAANESTTEKERGRKGKMRCAKRKEKINANRDGLAEPQSIYRPSTDTRFVEKHQMLIFFPY